MLVIRLRRIGKKNKPSYRIVAAEHTAPIGGKFIDDLGFYNPHTKKVNILTDKVMSWLDKGALPSNTVAKLLVSQKMTHKSIKVKTRKPRPSKVKQTAQTAKPTEKPMESFDMENKQEDSQNGDDQIDNQSGNEDA